MLIVEDDVEALVAAALGAGSRRDLI